MTDAEQCAQIIAIAREIRDNGEMPMTDVDIYDDAEIEQQPDGCWVAARVWVPNVYITDDGEA